jgi:hypothetical protein
MAIEDCTCDDLLRRRGQWRSNCPAAKEHAKQRDEAHVRPVPEGYNADGSYRVPLYDPRRIFGKGA